MAAKWTADQMPSQQGKIAVVTGANSGIGFETTAELAARGATVIMACRSLDKANRAADEIRARHSSAQLEIMPLDLSDLDSTRKFADDFKSRYGQLDILCNNGGVMGQFELTHTQHGFETMFGTNHLGHFALVGHLLDVIKTTPGARVVVVSSVAHKKADNDYLDDPNYAHREYKLFDAYGTSKLANTTYCMELDRRLKGAGIQALAVSAHPGYSASNITSGANPEGNWFKDLLGWLGNKTLAMPTHKGALPTLYAATMPDIQGSEYIGPVKLGGFYGYPERGQVSDHAADPQAGKKLWEISQQMTGVSYL